MRVVDVMPSCCAPGEGEDPMQISFTTAQQNCRSKGQGKGAGGGKGGMGGMGGMGGGGMQGGGMGGGMGGGKGMGMGGKGGPNPQSRSRSIYCGNLPQSVTKADLGTLGTPYGLVEAVRFMPQQTYASTPPLQVVMPLPVGAYTLLSPAGTAS